MAFFLVARDIGSSAGTTMDGSAPNDVDNTGGSLWQTKNTNTDLLRDDDGAGTNGIIRSDGNDHELLDIGDTDQRVIVVLNCRSSGNASAGCKILIGHSNKDIGLGDGYGLTIAPNAATEVKLTRFVAGTESGTIDDDPTTLLNNVDITVTVDLEDQGGGNWKITWTAEDGTNTNSGTFTDTAGTVTPGNLAGLFIIQTLANGGFAEQIELYNTIEPSSSNPAALLLGL